VALPLRQVDEQPLQLGLGDRLEQVLRITVLPVLRWRRTGNDVDRYVLVAAIGTQGAMHLPAAYVRQQDVHDHRREALLFQGLQALLAVSADDAGKTMALTDFGHHRGEIE